MVAGFGGGAAGDDGPGGGVGGRIRGTRSAECGGIAGLEPVGGSGSVQNSGGTRRRTADQNSLGGAGRRGNRKANRGVAGEDHAGAGTGHSGGWGGVSSAAAAEAPGGIPVINRGPPGPGDEPAGGTRDGRGAAFAPGSTSAAGAEAGAAVEPRCPDPAQTRAMSRWRPARTKAGRAGGARGAITRRKRSEGR